MSRKRAIGRARARRSYPPRTFRQKGGGCLVYMLIGVVGSLITMVSIVFI